jgi:hypothetical protein
MRSFVLFLSYKNGDPPLKMSPLALIVIAPILADIPSGMRFVRV